MATGLLLGPALAVGGVVRGVNNSRVNKQIELRRLQETKQREGQQLRTEGLKAIEVKLEPVFKQIRDEGNYDLIINNVPGVVLMVNDKIDLSAKVLDLLNASG